MLLANDVFLESFRALRPEKLGSAVLELCRDRSEREAGSGCIEKPVCEEERR